MGAQEEAVKFPCPSGCRRSQGPEVQGLLVASLGWLGLRFGTGGKVLTLRGVRLAGGSRAALPSWGEPPQSCPRRRRVLSRWGITALGFCRPCVSRSVLLLTYSVLGNGRV